MGWNPFKAVKKAVKGVTKPFKKVLRSPIGKIAGLAALYYGAPMLGGYGAGGAGWKKMLTAKAPWLYKAGEATVPGYPDLITGKGTGSTGILANLGRKWSSMGTLGKAATIGGVTMGAGAIGDDVIDEKETVIDTSGHEGYLNARKNFIDEWADWYMQQGDDEETAYAKASEAMFNDGGIVGLAQGGRIGLKKGSDRQPGFETSNLGQTGKSQIGGKSQGDLQKDIHNLQSQMKGKNATAQDYVNVYADPSRLSKIDDRKITKSTWDKIQDWNRNFQTKANKQYLKGNIDYYARNKKLAPALLEMIRGPKFADEDYYGLENVNPQRMLAQFGPIKQAYKDDIRTMSGLLDQDVLTRTDIKDWLPDDPVQTGGGEGGQEEWRRLGYPSQAAYLAAMQGGGGGGVTPANTTGDYYGFQEWQDWDPNNTTPLFGDATQYKAVLSKGGRIGLYAGGMGGMNNPMNPMMNRGLGAMGSPGMNPFNQQNLMAQGQMRGNPMMARGNPMMGQRPGIPAHGPGISGTQAAAKMAKKEDDGELLKLIRMLASMGIPMEQLRGRTKEELVEMAISLQKDQPTGRPEVVEESEEVEEEVVEAAGGGRIHAAEGYPNPEEEYIDVSGEAGTRYLRENAPGLLGEMYSEEEEEEEVVIPKAGGGLMRTKYAMGSEQPVIPSKDGPQLDFRNTGGYQPHGKAEKHDDVRALLAQGEFVVTSDAVKGIGGGDRDLGAKRMYDMMHKYEPIGRALS